MVRPTINGLCIPLYIRHTSSYFFFFFNDTATTEIYTLSLHDALPISWTDANDGTGASRRAVAGIPRPEWTSVRSEEHTSELQSPCNLVCRLLLEKKKKKIANLSLHVRPSLA